MNKFADKAIQDFYKMICDNIWIKYFFYIEKSNKLQENWIDLEAEIFKVIQYFENTSKNNENSSVKQMKFYLKDANSKKNHSEKNTEILEIDLKRMTACIRNLFNRICRRNSLGRTSQEKLYRRYCS